MNPLSKRARSVLYSVVTEFIATGEPVASRTIAKKHGIDLSTASIRNVLADLEDAGYLAQPHTSAGRVPTEAAFRLFVDALMRIRRLPEGEAGRITEWLAKLGPDADIPRETGKLLSNLSGSPALVLRSPTEGRQLLKLRFIVIRPLEMLAVAVFGDGTVENRFLRVDKPIEEAELARLHGLLEELAPGRTLSGVRDAVAKGMGERRDELAALHQIGYSLLKSAAGTQVRPAEIVIEGRSLLLDKAEFGSVERLRELLHALEDREKLVGLLDRTLGTDQVQVFLGEETASAVGYPVSVVATRFQDRGEPGGAVGVIGPTRMDYPRMVPLVAAAAGAVTTALAQRQPREETNDGTKDE